MCIRDSCRVLAYARIDFDSVGIVPTSFFNILRRFGRYEDSLLFFLLFFCGFGPLGGFQAEFHLGVYQGFSPFILFLIETGGLKDMRFYIVTEFQIQHKMCIRDRYFSRALSS